MKHSIIVPADWDEEAKVWVASSADLDGLATEAETLEKLNERIVAMVSELIELNGLLGDGTTLPEIAIDSMAQQLALAPNPNRP